MAKNRYQVSDVWSRQSRPVAKTSNWWSSAMESKLAIIENAGVPVNAPILFADRLLEYKELSGHLLLQIPHALYNFCKQRLISLGYQLEDNINSAVHPIPPIYLIDLAYGILGSRMASVISSSSADLLTMELMVSKCPIFSSESSSRKITLGWDRRSANSASISRAFSDLSGFSLLSSRIFDSSSLFHFEHVPVLILRML